MDEPVVLQTGPESFQVLGTGRRVEATVGHDTRRGLGLQGVPPVQVATELVRFLLERDGIPQADGPVDLGAAAGRYPEFVEEIRARLG